MIKSWYQYTSVENDVFKKCFNDTGKCLQWNIKTTKQTHMKIPFLRLWTCVNKWEEILRMLMHWFYWEEVYIGDLNNCFIL